MNLGSVVEDAVGVVVVEGWGLVLDTGGFRFLWENSEFTMTSQSGCESWVR